MIAAESLPPPQPKPDYKDFKVLVDSGGPEGARHTAMIYNAEKG